MGERKSIVRHCEAGEVLAAYRSERDGIRRSHLQVIWLLLSGEAVPEVERLTGFCERWISLLIDRWNASGLDGLGDRRRKNAGAKLLLDDEGMAALAAALETEPEDGGLWSGAKVAAWMSARLNRPVSPDRGLDYLHRLGFSRQRPRPRHAKAASPEDQETFKKNWLPRWQRRSGKTLTARSKSTPSTSTGSV
jgi:transposase